MIRAVWWDAGDDSPNRVSTLFVDHAHGGTLAQLDHRASEREVCYHAMQLFCS
jgi:hypothetical protein